MTPRVVAGLLTLVPLLALPSVAMFVEATPRASVILVAAAILLVIRKDWRRSPLLESWDGRWFVLLLGCEAMLLVASSCLAADASIALFGTGWRRFGLVSQLAILVIALAAARETSSNPEHFPLVLRGVAISGFLVSLFGIAQYFGWDPWLHASQVKFSGQFRPPGTFGNPTYFANFLIFSVFAGLGVALESGQSLWRGAGWLTAAAGTFALLLTGTRSALAGLLIGIGALVWRLRPRLERRHAVGLIVLPALAVVFVISAPGGKLRDRLSQWIQDPVGGPRLLLYRDTIRLASSHLLLGIGPDCFETEFPRRQSPELARAYPDFYEESPHNVCLEYLTAQGLGGLICFLGLTGLGLAAALRGRRSILSAVLLACLAASFVAHQFNAFVLPTALLYYVVLGTAVGMTVPGRTAGAAKSARFAYGSWVDSASMAMAALFVVIAGQWCFLEFRWRQVKSDLDSGNIREALQRYGSIESARPGVPGLDLWFSQQLESGISTVKPGEAPASDVLASAIGAATRACRTSPDRQNAFYNLGILGLLHNDSQAAEKAFRAAAGQAPNWYKPHLLLAEILLQSNRAYAAEEEGAKALDLSGGQHPEIRNTLEAARSGRAGDAQPAPPDRHSYSVRRQD
jgi:O-antigen ligase